MKRFAWFTTLLAAFGVVFVLTSAQTHAAKDPNTQERIPVGCPGSTNTDSTGKTIQNETNKDCPGGGRLNRYGTYIPPKDSKCGTPGIPSNLCDGDRDIQDWANFISNWLVGLISIIAVLMIVISGIQMVTSAGNPDALKAAKGRLTNAVIGLVTLISMKLILNWLGVL